MEIPLNCSLLWDETKNTWEMLQTMYGKIMTKKEPIRTLGFTSRLPCHILNLISLLPAE